MGFRHAIPVLALILSAAVTPLSSSVIAADEAAALIVDLRNKVCLMLNDQQLSSPDRLERLRTLMSETFDFPKIARTVLGRYWQTASEAEQKEFTRVFEDYMARTYATDMGDLRGEAFHVNGQRAESSTTTLVNTNLVQLSTGLPLRVDWRLSRTPDGYKIIDVSVEGISIVTIQREEFAAAIQQSGGKVTDLIGRLRTKLAAQP